MHSDFNNLLFIFIKIYLHRMKRSRLFNLIDRLKLSTERTNPTLQFIYYRLSCSFFSCFLKSLSPLQINLMKRKQNVSDVNKGYMMIINHTYTIFFN